MVQISRLRNPGLRSLRRSLSGLAAPRQSRARRLPPYGVFGVDEFLFIEFDPGSQHLEKEGSNGSVLAKKTEREVKVLGYEEQELINAKTP